jgi:hypothetical protein
MKEHLQNIADNEDGLIPSPIQLLPTHAAALSTTEAHASMRNTIRGHNLKIKKMLEWMQTNYPTDFTSFTVLLTPEQRKEDEGLKFYKNKYDFKYQHLQVNLVKAFISANKIKSTDPQNGNHTYYGYDNLRKYNDAILYGAKQAKFALSATFKQELKVFTDFLKKE